MCGRIRSHTGREFMRHILNTAGIVRFLEARYDMVRLGIGLYGIDPSEQVQQQLKPVAAFRSVV